MAREKQLFYYTEENQDNPFKDDITVNLTVSGIPSRLLKEFMQGVVNEQYPGGISPAIKDLMWLAVQKSKERQVKLGVWRAVMTRSESKRHQHETKQDKRDYRMFRLIDRSHATRYLELAVLVDYQ